MASEQQRLITVFRTEDPLVWDFHISENHREAEEVMANLKRRGIKKATTYPLGNAMHRLSIALEACAGSNSAEIAKTEAKEDDTIFVEAEKLVGELEWVTISSDDPIAVETCEKAGKFIRKTIIEPKG